MVDTDSLEGTSDDGSTPLKHSGPMDITLTVIMTDPASDNENGKNCDMTVGEKQNTNVAPMQVDAPAIDDSNNGK